MYSDFFLDYFLSNLFSNLPLNLPYWYKKRKKYSIFYSNIIKYIKHYISKLIVSE